MEHDNGWGAPDLRSCQALGASSELGKTQGDDEGCDRAGRARLSLYEALSDGNEALLAIYFRISISRKLRTVAVKDKHCARLRHVPDGLPFMCICGHDYFQPGG